MKTFQEFVAEAYDASVMSSSQVRRSGEGGRVGAKRKKTTPERRRMKAVGGGKMEPVEYKDRKDIGTQKARATREQQPTQERGSARERQLAAAKEERRKAAKARAAAKKGGETTTAAAKPKAKEVEKTASKLLSTKKPQAQAHPSYKPAKASGYTRAERQRLMRAGEAELEKRVREAEAEKQGKKPKEVVLKNLKKSWS